MNIEEVREYLLSLPNVEEVSPFSGEAEAHGDERYDGGAGDYSPGQSQKLVCNHSNKRLGLWWLFGLPELCCQGGWVRTSHRCKS